MEDVLEKLQKEYEAKPTVETRQAIHEELKKSAEYTLDLDNLPKIKHRWVDRGAVLSCEGAGHPNHRVFKRM